jgi:hypothetical protein
MNSMVLAFVTSTPSTPSFSLVELIFLIFNTNVSVDFKPFVSDNEMFMAKAKMLQI